MTDVNKIRNEAKVIQLLANTELCTNLLKEDKNKYFEYMRELYPDFAQKYIGLFKKIIYKEDLAMLDVFLNQIEELENGTSTEKDITANIGEILAEKYLYPVLGKPETKTEKQPEFVTK